MSTDIIIPLGNGSKANNDELKIFLRSLEKYGSGYDKIWLITSYPPSWIKPDLILNILWYEDNFKHNKDANLFEKLILGMSVTKASNIIWTCDDCALLNNIDLSTLLPIYNKRSLDFFEKNNPDHKWHKRMISTLKEINMTEGNWDAHCPQLWNVEKAMSVIQQVPYKEPEGRCINTAVMGRIYNSKIPSFALSQKMIKETVENRKTKAKFDCTFISYNDDGFLNGLRSQLFKRFPLPSKWEK